MNGENMEFLILESFIKSIPREKNEEVINKIKVMTDLKKIDIAKKKIPSGYKIEQITAIKNKEVYKFKLNKKDRILFTYGENILGIRDEFKNHLVLLSYSNHDRQITKAKNISLNRRKSLTLVDLNNYLDEEELEKAELKIDLELDLNINNLLPLVADKESITDIFEEDSKIYYLDDEQIKAIEQYNSGKMIFGSAGSGKTTISLYRMIAILNNNPNSKICYITYSNVLKKHTEELFHQLIKRFSRGEEVNTKDVKFYTLEEYAIKKCNIESIAQFESFYKWYLDRYYKMKKYKYEPITIWKEIRGVLTGLIGKDLFNGIKIPLSVLNKDYQLKGSIKSILDNYINIDGEIFQIKENKSIYDLKVDLERIDSKYAINLFKSIFSCYKEEINKNKVMNLEDYKSLNKFTSIEKKDRKEIHEIALKYINYSDEKTNQKISNFAFKENISLNQDSYDYLIIDEIQDLTEIELFYLMTLVKNKKNILLTGDFNQTINPTFFEAGRIEGIYKIFAGFNNLDKSNYIKRNYRSVDKIVKLSNVLIEKRNSLFTNKRREFEHLEEAVRKSIDDVIYIKGVKKNVDRFMEDIKLDYKIIVVVANEEGKKDLIKRYDFLKFRTYTISEVKGIESKKVLLFNLISDNRNAWKYILSQEKIHDDSYRYFFNMIYVGITRARENLYIIEEEKNHLLEILKNDVRYFELWEGLSNIEVSTVEDILEEAEKRENDEMYENAIGIYSKLIESKYRDISIKAINRCKILKKLQENKNINEAIKKLIDMEELVLAEEKAKVYNRINLYLNVLLLNNEYKKNDIKEKLFKEFASSIEDVINRQEEIQYMDLIIEKYYGIDLNKLINLQTETFKITKNIKGKI